MLPGHSRGLDILKQVLGEIVHAFPKEKLDATLTFADNPDYTSPAGFAPLAQGFLKLSGRNVGSHVRIEKEVGASGGYRISISAGDEHDLSHHSHVVHVPRGAEGAVNNWIIDAKAARNNHQLHRRLDWVRKEYKDPLANTSAIGVLFYDAAMSRVEQHSPYEVVRRSDGKKHKTYIPVREKPKLHL